jgi:hypothetical protein
MDVLTRGLVVGRMLLSSSEMVTPSGQNGSDEPLEQEPHDRRLRLRFVNEE